MTGNRITKADLEAMGWKPGCIERTLKCTLRGNTVILETKDPDGRIKKHYHRYGSQEKAEYYWHWFGDDRLKVRE